MSKKYKIIYDKNGRVKETKEIPDNPVKIIQNQLIDTKVLSSRPVFISPKPSKTEERKTQRSITIAIEMVKMGIRNWEAIKEYIIFSYKNYSQKGDKYIEEACENARQYLIKQGIL